MGTSAIESDSSFNPDAWAITFVDLAWLQPISEAFDDDASGFITTAEVNRFTSSRPANWRFVRRHVNRHDLMICSLPHWLAFWAVGGLSVSLNHLHPSR